MAYTTIDDPKKHHKSIIFTGDGNDDRALTVGFEPDFTWMRQRTDASGGYLVDSIRGNNAALQTTNVNAEGTFASMTFTSTGITVSGNENLNNENAHDYVAWNFKGSDSTAASNTDGSINSTVSANTTAGFSVITYAGSGSAGTIGHGLGVIPDMIIIKCRDTDSGADGGFVTWHKNMTGAFASNGGYAYLNSNSAAAQTTVFYDGTGISSSVISFRGGNDNINESGNDYVAYAMNSVKGYSQFGSFEGNGTANGTYVYTGFKPAFLLFKNIDAGSREWGIIDSARSTTNKTLATLEPSKAAAENTSDNFDFFANGFRAASTDPGGNANNETIIYWAVAENPFVSSKGVPTTAR